MWPTDKGSRRSRKLPRNSLNTGGPTQATLRMLTSEIRSVLAFCDMGARGLGTPGRCAASRSGDSSRRWRTPWRPCSAQITYFVQVGSPIKPSTRAMRACIFDVRAHSGRYNR